MTFEEAVAYAIEVYEEESGTPATRTRNMIAEHGEQEALSRLMLSPDLQKGFRVLRDKDRLDVSFEALVVRFQKRFSRDAVEAAQWRLDNAEKLL